MTTDGDERANRDIPLLDGAPEREQSGKEAPAGDHATTTGNQSALGLLRRTGSAPQTSAVVTIVQPKSGKQQRSSWVWQAMQEFSPAVHGKNVRCVVEVTRKGTRQPCGQLFAHRTSNGTSTLAGHIEKLHPSTYSQLHVPGPGSKEARDERAAAAQGTH